MSRWYSPGLHCVTPLVTLRLGFHSTFIFPALQAWRTLSYLGDPILAQREVLVSILV